MSFTNKVVYVKAFFKPLGKSVKVKNKNLSREWKKGILGSENDEMLSDCEIDGERLSEDVATAIASLNQEGYEVIAVLPVISGNYFYKYQSAVKYQTDRLPFVPDRWETISDSPSYGFGYGFSYTEGVSIIAKKLS
ncbi:MAG: hypothetical protein LBQ75_01255 [Zoogloeaceae bacterium]|jgi:hypothetical protein|nr:hypothetical protein [Zoogloeaceae bacterium]